MKILCILQNQWFKDPERVRQMLARYDESFRRNFIKRALFYGCRTGKVLQAVFGEEWIARMTFEEASRNIGGHSASKFTADPGHIMSVIREVEPDIVLAFGKVAEQAVMGLSFGGSAHQFSVGLNKTPIRIYGPHPTARGGDTLARLFVMRKRLEQELSHIDIPAPA